MWQEHVSCEGCLHPLWLPEAAAHVPHGDARDDQPNSVHRQAMDAYASSSSTFDVCGFQDKSNSDGLE